MSIVSRPGWSWESIGGIPASRVLISPMPSLRMSSKVELNIPDRPEATPSMPGVIPSRIPEMS